MGDVVVTKHGMPEARRLPALPSHMRRFDLYSELLEGPFLAAFDNGLYEICCLHLNPQCEECNAG